MIEKEKTLKPIDWNIDISGFGKMCFVVKNTYEIKILHTDTAIRIQFIDGPYAGKVYRFRQNYDDWVQE